MSEVKRWSAKRKVLLEMRVARLREAGVRLRVPRIWDLSFRPHLKAVS
ncbi:MAG: hypothetical protein R6U87_04995 [Thiohalospira sp.]